MYHTATCNELNLSSSHENVLFPFPEMGDMTDFWQTPAMVSNADRISHAFG